MSKIQLTVRCRQLTGYHKLLESTALIMCVVEGDHTLSTAKKVSRNVTVHGYYMYWYDNIQSDGLLFGTLDREGLDMLSAVCSTSVKS